MSHDPNSYKPPGYDGETPPHYQSPDPHGVGSPPPSGTQFQQSLDLSPDDRQTAMLAHMLGALMGFLGPLIIWLVKKDSSSFVNDQSKEALNFQLTLAIAYVASGVIWFIFSLVTCGFGAMVPFPVVVTVVQIVFGIIGGMKANEGYWYRYPMTIRMIT
ncbi:DUF4870 domain-containing protein [Lignipirellula cremea]|nr:DUF4870 domain-containing protein [Lignipirellula cremea]